MKEKKLVPKRRFEGFQDLWMTHNWSETVDISTNMVDPRKEKYDDLFHVGPGNIESFSGKILDNVKKVKEENLISGKFYFKPGDIIYGKIRPQLGKYALAEVEGLASADAYILNAKNGVSQNFFFTILQSKGFYKYSVSVSSRTGMPKINRNELNQYQYFAPSLKEQQKIGEFFKQLDQVITLQQRKLEKTKALKSAYLAEMFPAKGERVPKRRFAGFTGEWDIIKIGDLMDVTSVRRIHQSDWTNEGVRFLRARDIVSYSKNQRPRGILYISEDKYIEYSRVSGKVEQGDLLVTGVGTIGVPFLIRNNKPIYFKDGNIIWFRNQNKVNNYFLYYSFTTKGIQNYIKTIAGIGTVGTYTIENGKQTSLYLPTIKEQQVIGEFFKKLDDSIANQQQKLDKLKAMKQAYLQEMFV